MCSPRCRLEVRIEMLCYSCLGTLKMPDVSHHYVRLGDPKKSSKAFVCPIDVVAGRSPSCFALLPSRSIH